MYKQQVKTKTTLLKNQIILKNNNSYDLILSELIEELKLTDLNQYQTLLINYDLAELYKLLNNKIKFKEHTIIAFNIYKYILNSLEEDSSKNLFTNKIMNIKLVENYNALNIPMHN